ncbi:hypothetical protein F4678DRAFT_200289 [Xylaria arbuscula]|nr:hypothetical protein F4678DRAFT_200289 [Xylaria arbuscula]
MGASTPIPPESAEGLAHPTTSQESGILVASIHRHQYHDDPPPAYIEYALSRPQAPIPTAWQQLRKPIAIPATAASLGSPFLRAYPSSLENFQISRSEFLDILDGLNRVAVQSPPLRALGLVGEVLEVVPLSTAQVVGFVVNSAAKIGKYALSKGATEAYLQKVNEETFVPRGLKMEIAKLEAMARINRIPILDTAGRIRGDTQLLQPLLDVQEIQTIGATQRWLRALEPWVEPLDLENLPPINTDTHLWGRLHTTASEHERKASEKKVLKDRSKAFDKHQKEMDKAEEKKVKALAKLEKKEQKAHEGSCSDKVEDKLRKIDERRERAELKHYDKIEKAAEDSKGKDKEAKAMTKVLWLIIRNLHDTGALRVMDTSEEYRIGS